nr:hypothetical protein [uncultured Duganella sp.]
MIYLQTSPSATTVKISSVAQLSNVIATATLTPLERTALRSLIFDDQVKKTYLASESGQLLQDIRHRIHSLPRAFDDLAIIRPPTRLGETGVTVARQEEVEYRINNTVKRNMVRILAGGGSPLANKELALYGFCKLGGHIFKKMGADCLYVCVGRSPTPIAAWLQTLTPKVCMLPFSGARLDDLTDDVIATARQQTRPHFESMLAPYLASTDKMVLVDYSTSGESLLTMYSMVHDFLATRGMTCEVSCLSIWQSQNTERAAAPAMAKFLQAARTRSNGGDETRMQSLIRRFLGDSFVAHLHIKELIEEQFGDQFSYATRWPVDMRAEMLGAMMNMLDNQSFDFLSPYKKSSILAGATAPTFMGEEGLRRFEQLKGEMQRVAKDRRELDMIIAGLP